MRLRIQLAITILVLAALPAFSVNLVTNPSFEDPSYLDNSATWGLNALNGGWQVWSPGVATVGVLRNTYGEGDWGVPGDLTPYPLKFNAADGVQHVDLTGIGNTGVLGLYQGLTTVVGQLYTVSFQLGNLGLGANSGVCGNQLCTTIENNYAESAKVMLIIRDGIDQSTDRTTTHVNTIPGTGRDVNWQTVNYTFLATSTDTNIHFWTGGLVNDSYVGLDDVFVDVASIPEPGTVAMMGAGLIALGLLRKRFRRN